MKLTNSDVQSATAAAASTNIGEVTSRGRITTRGHDFLASQQTARVRSIVNEITDSEGEQTIDSGKASVDPRQITRQMLVKAKVIRTKAFNVSPHFQEVAATVYGASTLRGRTADVSQLGSKLRNKVKKNKTPFKAVASNAAESVYSGMKDKINKNE